MSLKDLPQSVREFLFQLRTKVLGQVQLRSELPRPVKGLRFERERKFYALLLSEFSNVTELNEVTEVYDVGCRNWSYAPALATAFPRARLVGVEVDGGRRYWNLHRRIDAAASQARELSRAGHEARVVFDDFRHLSLSQATEGCVLYCFFYPFVSERPCRSWGLPVSFADFHSLLVHTRTSLARRTHVLSVHQGEWEAELAREAYARAGLECREAIVKPSSFIGLWPNAYDVHVLLVTDARLR